MDGIHRMNLGNSSNAVRKGGGSMTLAEFYKFVETTPDGERWEFQAGQPICQASPSIRHQEICGSLYSTFNLFFKGYKCRPMLPCDVQLFKRLDRNGEESPVFIPDLLVLCDLNKSDGKRIIGAPDLVVEVWSPSNSKEEQFYKMSQYKLAGVRELLEVFPDKETCLLHTLSVCGIHDTSLHGFNEVFPSRLFDGLVFDLTEFATTQ